MAALNVKTFEKNVTDYWSKLIYAVFDDMNRMCENDKKDKYSSMIYQSYQNLIVEKDKRLDKLSSRFTVSTEVRQYLTILYKKMIDEVSNIEIIDSDSVEDIIEKLIDANTDCFSAFMFELSGKYKARFGATLNSAGDSTKYFQVLIMAQLKNLPAKIGGLISDEYDGFLKALAYMVGTYIWYHETSVSAILFHGHLAVNGMEQLMIDELTSNLRAKAPAKPREKKGTTPKTAKTAEVLTPEAIEERFIEADDGDEADDELVDEEVQEMLAVV